MNHQTIMLFSDIDLKKAKIAQLPVLVKWADIDEIADYGGPIEKISSDAVKINGMHYKKDACRYYVR